MRISKLTLLLLGATVAVATSAHAGTLNLVANTAAEYGAGRENSGLDVDLALASANFNQTSNSIDANPIEAIVALDFDGLVIPAGQQIDSATLTLAVMNFGSAPAGSLVDLPVYALNTTFDGPTMTWNSSENGVSLWTTSGAKDSPGDIDGTTESITTVTIPNSGNVPYAWDVTSLIQTQYDGGTLSNGILVGGRTPGGLADNLGLVAIAGYGGIQGAGTQPKLDVTFSDAIPEPTTLVLGLISMMGLLATRRRDS